MTTQNSRSFRRYYDYKMLLSFGALILLLMLIATNIASYLCRQLFNKEEDRLSGILATVLAKSIDKVSFSGKYHARLFVEEMQSKLPELSFISVETKEGLVLAHSQPEKNDKYMNLTEEDISSRNLCIEKNNIVSESHSHNGPSIKEVLIPYRSGLNNQVEGIVRIGIKMDAVQQERRVILLAILIMNAVLTIVAIFGVLILSCYFGGIYGVLATRLQGIMTYSPIPIFITAKSGEILIASGKFEQIFRVLAKGQNIMQVLKEKFSPDGLQKLLDFDKNIFKNGGQIEEEIGSEFQGRPSVWQILKFPIAYDKKAEVNAVCTIINDVTERKLAGQKIVEAKEQWEGTFNAIGDVITVQDKNMRIIRANKAAGKLFDGPVSKLIGRSCYEVFRDASEPCPECPVKLSRFDMQKHQGRVTHEILDKTFEISVFPIYGDAVISGFVHVAKDITKQLIQEEKLKHVLKMEAIGVLAGGIAHDFNNILTPVMGYTELALEKIELNDPLYKNLQEIKRAVLRAKNLIRQILTFSHYGSQKKELFQPSLILREALQLIRAAIPATIEFMPKIEDNCGLVIGDPTEFHQIIMNLCTNAYQAMEPNAGTLSITLSQVIITSNDDKVSSHNISPGAYVLLSVRDTGRGMDHKTVERIFDPYFSAKQNCKGSGLGLSTVHGIVERWQGHILVFSEPGKGTKFEVYLPSAAMDKIIPDKTDSVPTPSAAGSEHILIVEDEKAILSMYCSMLMPLGYRVSTFENPSEPLPLIEQNPFLCDLIVTDMTLPCMNGIEFAEKVLSINPKMPIILCSGSDELIIKKLGGKLDIRAYLMKPMSMQELTTTVRNVLDKEKKHLSQSSESNPII